MSFADMFLHVHSSACKLDRHPSFHSQNWKFKMHLHDSMAMPQSDVSFANMASFQGLISSSYVIQLFYSSLQPPWSLLSSLHLSHVM